MKYTIKAYQIWEFGQRKDDQGNPHQEDSIFPPFNQVRNDEDRLFILCDGMGGHESGEVASAAVCEAMSAVILPKNEKDVDEALIESAVAAACKNLDRKDTGGTKKMGTTMTLLDLAKNGAIIAHIGDSRVYHIRPGKDAQSTKIMHKTCDHSLVNDLLKIGELTEEEAKTFNRKNVITRALQPGMDNPPKADVYHTTDVKPGDIFYLCSDGMLENMGDDQLCYQFSDAAGKDEEKVERLRTATMENKDNHTAFIIRVTDVDREGMPEPAVVAELEEDMNAMASGSAKYSSSVVPAANMGMDRRDMKLAQKQKKRGNTLYLFLTLAVAIVAGLVVYFFVFNKDENASAETPSINQIEDMGGTFHMEKPQRPSAEASQEASEPSRESSSRESSSRESTPAKKQESKPAATKTNTSSSANKPAAQTSNQGGKTGTDATTKKNALQQKAQEATQQQTGDKTDKKPAGESKPAKKVVTSEESN